MASEGLPLFEKFTSIGLEPKLVQQTLNNPKFSKVLSDSIDEAGIFGGCEKSVGVLIYAVASKLSEASVAHRPTLLSYVVQHKITSTPQLDAAFKYFKTYDNFDAAVFEPMCGVGVVVTPEQITSTVAAAIQNNRAELETERYRANFNKILADIKAVIPWADGKAMKEEFDAQILALLGPKTEADLVKVKPKKDKKDEKTAPATTTAGTTGTTATEETKSVQNIEELYVGRDLKEARNSEAILRKVREATGGKIITRFPPEPNGYLHIGHAKSMNFNFGLANRNNGECILRFDDTNPDAESVEYIENIIENVKWMGHSPARITYSSDYFDQLYELAKFMIRKGFAYVDHQTKAEMQAYRDARRDSPWRNRPIEESLRLFEDMRKGKFAEGEATLRMKGDMSHPNPCMWDMIAYRIKYTPHPHVGNKWCIYPSYDYTHCIIDSLEYISYSLCTLEFEVRRDTYYWLLDVLELYRPMVWEFSRLNITNNVLSKRKLLTLVMDRHVRGWDDPRLFTINGLRRRGYTPEAINNFCDLVGVSRNDNTINAELLEHCIRLDLDRRANRVMAVLDPVKITLINWPADKVEWRTAPNHPKDESRGTRQVPLSRVVYIDRSDFRELEESKSFYGLTLGREVHLKYAYNIKCESYIRNADGQVVEVLCSVDLNNTTKCKGNIQWVAEPQPGQSPLRAEVRLYETLFQSPNPASLENWLADINPNSLTIVHGYVEPSLANVQHLERFQFERMGYFVVDYDTSAGNLVFNRTVKLKEAKEKVAASS
eukprot:TRINITY_DN3900_c0_g2_i1.p1 TRINITY_DN3900_c0_g2~~TRINITY_DN3900_c0_g2_i1.p1  ORF type:complete len:774 (+),score=335.21 TRINITY_DN3900_c0_g2_i1:58-2379(+)